MPTSALTTVLFDMGTGLLLSRLPGPRHAPVELSRAEFERTLARLASELHGPLQLVPFLEHALALSHTGGMAIWGGGQARGVIK